MHRSRAGLLGAVLLGFAIALLAGRLWLSPLGDEVAGRGLGATAPRSAAAPAPRATPPAAPLSTSGAPLTYTVRELDRATVHIVTVPVGHTVGVAIASPLDTVAAIAQQAAAAAAMNAGFFDPQNGETTSHVTVNGDIVADPRDNSRLMDNPDLAPYLPKILNRSEFRRYGCGGGSGAASAGGSTTQYAIAPHGAPSPEGCRIVDAVGGGPRLLPELTSVEEGFVAVVEGDRVRDALGETQPNARSAVGITATGEVLLVAVAQRPEAPGSGLTLAELADLMQALGAADALNLDGGSSTALYYEGQRYLGRWAAGEWVERPVKTALVVTD